MDKIYNKKRMHKYNPIKHDGKMKAIQQQLRKRKKEKKDKDED